MKNASAYAILRVVLPYVVMAGLWIFLSDRMVESLFADPAARTQWSIYKGLAFVLVTALLLFALLRAELRALERAREELRRSEADLAEAQRVAKIGCWRFDIASNAVRWSRELYRIFDVEEEAFDNAYESFLSCIHPEDRPRVVHANAEARAGGKPFEVEYRVLTRNGQVKTIREVGYAVKDDAGKVVGLFGTSQDITEQAQAEAALRESDERLRSLSDNLPDSYVYQYIQKADGTQRFLYLSAGVERLHGVKPEAGLRDASALRGQVAPEQLAALETEEAASRRDLSDFQMELRIRRDDGQWRWVQLRSRPRRTPDGQFIWDGVATDVTERKRAEEAVRESQQLLHLVLATLPVGVVVTDRAGNIVLVNAASKRIWGDTIVSGRERWIQSKGFWHDSGQSIVPENWASVRALSKGETSSNELIDIETYDGQQKTILNSSAPIRAPEGVIVGAVIVNEDVTERVRAEEALRESETKFRVLANGTASAIFIYRGDRYCYVNPAFQVITGYSEAELLKMHFWDVVDPEFRAMVRTRGLARQQGKHPPMRYEFKILTKFGDERWLDFTDGVTEFQGGLAALGTALDITERKQAELEARRSRAQLRALLARFEQLREEERTLLAREVHDVLGQMLTGLKMDMSWWERRFTKIADEPLRRALEEKVESTSRLTDMMIKAVQKISRELRPGVLDNIGLGAALQFEARQFQERTGIICEVWLPPETLPLEPDLATGIFRVLQELLTNVARHARARQVRVSLRQAEEKVTLEVRDDGRGIREEELDDPKSLGLLGMSERASLMGGTIEIAGTPGGGTKAVLTIPVKSG